jgi:hypothetical protein
VLCSSKLLLTMLLAAQHKYTLQMRATKVASAWCSIYVCCLQACCL